MHRLLATPKDSRIHRSLVFALSEDSLRRSLAAVSARVEGMKIGFTRFVGTTQEDMQRPDMIYYPVLAVFAIAPGRRYITFDDYQVETGLTALVYPVYRRHKGFVCMAVSKLIMPVCREWLAAHVGDDDQSSSFYVVHDRTFDELIFGASRVVGTGAGGRLRLVKSTQVVLRHQPDVAH